MDKLFFTVNEVAKLFSVEPQTIRVYIKEGKLKAHKLVGTRLLRIPREEIAYLLPKEEK